MSEFKTYFVKNIKPELLLLEKERISIMFKNYLMTYIILSVVIILAFAIPLFDSIKYYVLIFGTMFSLVINWAISNFDKREERYFLELKQKVIPKIIEQYSSDVYYKHYKHMPLKTFMDSGLCEKKFNKSSGSDFVKVALQNYSLTFSFIHTYEVVSRNYRGGTRQHIFTVFKGLFLILNMPDSLENRANLKFKYKNWKMREDEQYLYFAKELKHNLCTPNIFKSLMKADTFALTNMIFDEILCQ